MIKKKRQKRQTNKIEIDLSGPQGNAFYLLSVAHQLSSKLGMSTEDSQALQDRMTSGDYENLVNEFDKAFGHFVTLYR